MTNMVCGWCRKPKGNLMLTLKSGRKVSQKAPVCEPCADNIFGSQTVIGDGVTSSPPVKPPQSKEIVYKDEETGKDTVMAIRTDPELVEKAMDKARKAQRNECLHPVWTTTDKGVHCVTCGKPPGKQR